MLDAVAGCWRTVEDAKLCRCDGSGLVLPVRGLDTNDRAQLVNLLGEWNLPPGRTWGLGFDCAPQLRESLVEWAQAQRRSCIVSRRFLAKHSA